MSLILGTNCGLVTVAPTTDPAESGAVTDARSRAFRVTASADGTITEIGWWCSNNTEAANYQLGVYAHDAGNDKPDALLATSGDIAKGTTGGWKVATGFSLSITSGTTYWIALQLDNTATNTSVDRVATVGQEHHDSTTNSTSLVDPWGTSTASNQAYLVAIYALYTPTGGTVFNPIVAIF